MNNTGSFGSAIGGADPIKEALSRRGMGMGVTAQSTTTPQPIPSSPQGNPSLNVPQQPTGMTPMGDMQQKDDDQIILDALTNRLKANTKIKTAQAGI